MQVVSFDFN